MKQTIRVATRPVEIVRTWLQSGNNGFRLLAAALGALLGLVIGGYVFNLTWTGLPVEVEDGPKTLWDWLDLVLIPLVLIIGGYLLDRAQRQREQASLQDQHREVSLQKYFDHMTDLLMEQGLRRSEPDAEIRALARARTLTVIRRLDATRTADLLRFLHESELFEVIDLSNAALDGTDLNNAFFSGASLHKADLAGANLRDADLEDADLSGAILGAAVLDRANLCRANLEAANLEYSSLQSAKMHGAVLKGANLMGAECNDADLRNVSLNGAKLTTAVLNGADLSGATLNGANLSDTNLSGANLKGADLSNAILDNDTTLNRVQYDEDTQWPEAFEPPAVAEKADGTVSPMATPSVYEQLSTADTDTSDS